MKEDIYPHMLRLHGSRDNQYPNDDIKETVRKNLLCESCLHFRTSGGQNTSMVALRDKIYCSGCLKDHPSIFFSRQQRKATANARVCIGREGYVRLCRHKVVTWADISNAWKKSWNKSVLRCTDSTHDPTTEQKNSTGEISSDWTENNLYPKAVMSVDRNNFAVGLRLEWQLSAFALPLQPKEQLTMDSLHDKLKAVDSTVCPCPHESFESVSILRAFDPNYCVCLGAAIGIYSYFLPLERISANDSVCLHYRCSHYYEGIGIFLPLSYPCIQRERENGVPCEKCNGQNRIQHRSVCGDCETWYIWSRQGDQIKLRRSTKASALKTPLDPGWLRLLDPGSFDFEDPLTQHLLWCNNSVT